MTTQTREATLEEIVCWLNAWANRHRHVARNRDFIAGYEKAVSEVMDALEPLAPDWLETWHGRKWRRLLDSNTGKERGA